MFPTSHRTLWPRRRKQRLASLFAGCLAATLICSLLPSSALAQHTDEVWIMPGFYSLNNEPAEQPCKFFKQRDFRETLMSELTAIDAWPTAAQRISGFAFLKNLMAECVDDTASPD